MPKGEAFVEYSRFRDAYEVLKRTTSAFHDLTPTTVWAAMREDSLVFVVLRTVLGLTPGDWAGLAVIDRRSDVTQSAARGFDKSCRTDKDYVVKLNPVRARKSVERLEALVRVACEYLARGAPAGATDEVHKLNKFDTAEGQDSVRRVADLDVPYPVLLYERYLGLPFGSHKNAVSELIGNVMEAEIESRLHNAGISARKTKRAEKVRGFDQAPDFIVPDEAAPRVVIEAKIANDDGTARDKVTRIRRLVQISRERETRGKPGFQVVACVEGGGFGVRRQDMRNLLTDLNGKVFTLNTLDQLIPHTDLAKYVSRS